MFNGLIRIADIEKRTGFRRGTIYNYLIWGLLPPPRMRVGNVMLFAKEDINAFMRSHKGRPNALKSVRKARS